MRNQDLVVVTWNADGLSKKEEDLKQLIQQHDPDIILLQETQLGEGEPSLPNYRWWRTDRAGCGGGTAILARVDLPQER